MTALNNPPSKSLPHGHSTRCAYPKAKRLRPDMRTRAARRAKAFELAICAALGVQHSRLPVLLRSLVDSAVIAQVRLAEIRAAVARGEPIDDESATRWSGILHRVFDSLGLSPEGLERRKAAEAEAERKRLLDQHYPDRKWD